MATDDLFMYLNNVVPEQVLGQHGRVLMPKQCVFCMTVGRRSIGVSGEWRGSGALHRVKVFGPQSHAAGVVVIH